MITFLLCTPRIVTFTDRYFQSWLFDQTEIPQIPQGVQKSVGTNQFSRPLRRLPSDRARSPAKQRPSASTCHVTNRLLEYRRASWSDSIHTVIPRDDEFWPPWTHVRGRRRAFFRLVHVPWTSNPFATRLERGIPPHTERLAGHKSNGPSGDVNLPWHNGPIRTQTPRQRVSCCILNRFDSRFASSSFLYTLVDD